MAIRVGHVVVRIKHLDLEAAHEKHTAVAAPLAVAFHLGGRRELEVQLAVAKAFPGLNLAAAGQHLHEAVLHEPLHRLTLVVLPLRKVGAIEEDDGIGRRLAGLIQRAEGAGSNPWWLRPVAVVDGPRMMIVRSIPVEARPGGRAESRSGAKENESGGETESARCLHGAEH